MNNYSFNIGHIQCTAASDGQFNYPLATFFANARPEALQRALRAHGLSNAHITTPYTCLLLDNGGERVLVDTGAGRKAAISAALFPDVDNSASPTGRLPRNLRRAGVDPASIDKVILTHAHPDHVGGMLDEAGRLTYPNAHYFIARAEWDFWMGADAAQQVRPALVEIARANLQPAAARLTFVAGGDEVSDGVRVVDASGHTPGHIAVEVRSGDDGLLHISDLALHPLHLENPTWYPLLDISPSGAAAARARLLNQAAAEERLIFAHHFAPFPALGHIRKASVGWRWQPLSESLDEN